MMNENNIELEHTEIDVLIIANHAEAHNGLLYLSGGGWTDVHRQILNGVMPTNHFGVGLAIRVPWTETNVSHPFMLELQNDDATATLVHVDGEINMGRPATLPPGSVQHAVIAINIDTVFPAPGGYRIIANVDQGKSIRTWAFRVHDRKAVLQQGGPVG